VTHTEKSIDVKVPIRVAYNQWTQFEAFPRFMEGIKEVRQLDDKRLAWRAEIAGKQVEWTATIVDQVPDQIISWRSTGGPHNTGTVTFASLDPDQTHITLRLEYEPEGAAETIASAVGVVGARIHGDLERFKDFIESRGRATGSWRGEIQDEQVVKPDGKGAHTART
jgi:uncharacterized membrane protein